MYEVMGAVEEWEKFRFPHLMYLYFDMHMQNIDKLGPPFTPDMILEFGYG